MVSLPGKECARSGVVWVQLPTWGRVWQLSYSSLAVCAGCLSVRSSKKGSRKTVEHTVKQAWAPVSQYTVERGVNTQAFPSPVPAPTKQSRQLGRLQEGLSKSSVMAYSTYLRRPPWAPPPYLGRLGSAVCP